MSEWNKEFRFLHFVLENTLKLILMDSQNTSHYITILIITKLDILWKQQN